MHVFFCYRANSHFSECAKSTGTLNVNGKKDNITMSSRYDDLLNRFHTIATTKLGTRYEILAAMIAKILEGNHRVIHDLKLRGESDVKHQIDVTVEGPDGRKSLLIECKDFDVSGDKVGLAIVRNFWAVAADVKPDSAWIITCNGFTSEALMFAKAKGIKLVIVRIFEALDLDGRTVQIVLGLTVQDTDTPTAALCIDEADLDTLEEAKRAAGIGSVTRPSDNIHFILPDGTSKHFNEVMAEEMNSAMGTRIEGEVSVSVLPNGRRLFIGGMEVPYKGIKIDFAIVSDSETRTIVSERTAELIVQGIGDADLIIFDDQIQRHHIDPDTGEIR